jgi:hypothetical protein
MSVSQHKRQHAHAPTALQLFQAACFNRNHFSIKAAKIRSSSTVCASQFAKLRVSSRTTEVGMTRSAFAVSLIFTSLMVGSLGAGEPAAVAQIKQRDMQLHAVAVQKANQGDAVEALRTLAAVKTPSILAQAIRDIDAASQLHGRTAGDAAINPAPDQAVGGRGGAMVNFGPLVNLIQTTIAPDTWQETVGGPSTIAPYAAGIVVDPSGLVTDVTQLPAEDDLLGNIAILLARDHRPEVDFASASNGMDAWRLPSAVRCVSLRSLTKEIAQRRLAGRPIDDELRHLAGISRVRYVVTDPENQDVLLIGQVGGIESREGWMCDSRSGAASIRIDHLAACLAAVISRQPLGCSIDPTPQSLREAAEVSAAIRDGRVAEGIAGEALQAALGDQVVRVFGVAGDAPIAHLMVHTDRHMKRLSLGLEPMPQGVDNYLDVVAEHIRKGPPDGQLLRLWFTSNSLAVRSSGDGRVFELGGRPMKLQSETQRAGAAGDRLAAADDVRLIDFVDGFNRNLDEISRLYPAYAALESVYHAAAVAEIIHRTQSHSNLNRWLGPLLLDEPSAGLLHAPKRVASIAVGHSIRQGSKRHFLVLASGGVVLNPADLITGEMETYPTLDKVGDSASQSRGSDRWWWDVQR